MKLGFSESLICFKLLQCITLQNSRLVSLDNTQLELFVDMWIGLFQCALIIIGHGKSMSDHELFSQSLNSRLSIHAEDNSNVIEIEAASKDFKLKALNDVCPYPKVFILNTQPWR
jgi:hypothetical protein